MTAAHLLVVSSDDPDRLDGLLDRHADMLDRLETPAEVAGHCRAAALERDHGEFRCAVVAEDGPGLARALRAARAEPSSAVRGQALPGAPPSVVAVFSGYGAQWPGMGARLATEQLAALEGLEAASGALAAHLGWDPLAVLLDEASAPDDLDATAVCQPLVFCLQVALLELARSWGLTPDAVLGHSMGEVTAAWAAGAIGLDDAARATARRSALLGRLDGAGGMVVVPRGRDDLAGLLDGLDGTVVAAHNGPATTVLSGPEAELDELLRRLPDGGARVAVRAPAHGRATAALRAEVAAALGDLAITTPEHRLVSTVTGATVDGNGLEGEHWAAGFCSPVLLDEAVASLAAGPPAVWLEIGPQPSLAAGIRDRLSALGREDVVLPLLRRSVPGSAGPLTAAAGAWSRGVPVRLETLVAPGAPRQRIPSTPWHRRRHWPRVQPATAPEPDAMPAAERRVIVDAEILTDHRVRGRAVLPATTWVRELAAHAQALAGAEPVGLTGVALHEPLVLEDADGGLRAVELVLSAERAGAGTWTLQARADDGRLHATATAQTRAPEDAGARRRPAAEAMTDADAGAHAEALARAGLDHRPGFLLVTEVRKGPLTAEVTLRDGHPDAVLDGALQAVAAALPEETEPALHLPVGFESVELPADIAAVSRAVAVVRSVPAVGDSILADVVLLDAHGSEIGIFAGLRLERTGGRRVRVPALSHATYRLAWQPAPPVPSTPAPTAWTVEGPGAGNASLLDALRTPPDNAPPGVLVLTAGADTAGEAVAAISALARRSRAPGRTVVVTRGALATGAGEAADPAQAAVWGATRVLRQERPDVRVELVDVPADDARWPALLASHLATSETEPEVALRDGHSLVPRLRSLPTALAPSPAEAPGAEPQPYALTVGVPGVLGGLVLRPRNRTAPGEHEVEVEVEAAGVNFSDVLKVLGLYPGAGAAPPLGLEAAGVVRRVGAGVQRVRPGDRVVVLTEGAFASVVVAPEALVAPAPAMLPATVAAAIPVATLTAHHGLVELARMQPGETLLVHSAAGGVGLAAVHLAQAAGVHVLGTAGSETKRELLRDLGVGVVGDSRGLDWVEEVRGRTDGRGVDIVLNALAGEAIGAGLRVLAPHGRFVEIGRTEIHEGGPLGLTPFQHGLSFFAVDLTLLARDRPEELGAVLRSIVDRIDRGELPPPQTECVPVERTEDALRQLSQRRNTGKVVLGFAGREVVLVPARTATPDATRRDGTYVVTGGLGAVGRAAARWLARTRAKSIVLAGRTVDGADVGELRELGVTVEVVAADVADRASVDALLARARELGPLRGVVHAAGVLEDAVLERLDGDALQRVLAPKLDGARHLDAATREDDLELFLLVSSAAALLGSPGQGAYSAANAGLAAVAASRQAADLPALAVDLGPIAGGGMAAAGRSRLAAQGLRPMALADVVDALEALTATEHAHAALVDADWDRIAHAATAVPPVLADLAGAGVRRGVQASGAALRERLASAADPAGELLVHLRELVARGLGADPGDVPTDRGLTALGMDSLMVTELRNALQVELPVTLELRRLMEGQSLAELAAELSAAAVDGLGEAARADPDAGHAETEQDGGTAATDEHEPFALTPIQQAYLAGRSPDLPGGGVSCHSYTELRCRDLDLERFRAALQSIVDRHPTLRSVIGDDGLQRVLPDPGPVPIDVVDLRGLAPAARAAALQDERARRSHAVRPTGTWPLFAFSVALLDEREAVLMISFDLLLADGASLLLLTEELVAAYHDRALPPAPGVTFRRYHELIAGIDASGDRAWWDERLDDLPPAPELPVLPAAPGPPVFVRRTDRLEAADWRALRERASAHGLTASGVLLGAYAETLRECSKAPDFTLDVTTYLREPVHPDVHRVVGDFTSVLLVEIRREGASFVDRCRRVQGALLDALDHRRISGVELLREIARRRGLAAAAMPVIFTSLLTQDTGGGDISALEELGSIEHQITQTPQALLDHQVQERDGALVWNWDAVDARFPSGLLDEAFARHGELLRKLALSDEPWTAMRPLTAPAAPETEPAPPAPGLLHEPFRARAQEQPDAIAVRAAGRTMTYAELDAEAAVLAHRLRDAGADGDEPVVVLVDRGWEQVVAVLAILGAGTAYVPVDVHLPRARMADVVARSGARIAVVAASGSSAARAVGLEPVAVPKAGTAGAPWPEIDRRPEDLAYIIFTSGSTGRPKGVALDHRGPRTTIEEINRRWSVGARDVVLGLSSLSFDLSVWDVFGTLGAGGELVIPDPARLRDPGHWCELVRTHGVTVWNSVPALMQLALEQRGDALAPLRLVMLSGDWVPRPIAGQVRAVAPTAQVVSLGGATEGSIWSIAHPIDDELEDWPSVPYGRPLAGQDVRVVDDALDPRPAWVPGEIVIAGPGLAMGYHGDPDLTAAAFVRHPRTGERLYRTGDVGRYRPGGLIEFLGREDQQVKVQGFRVELGDVESALLRLPGVREAAAAVRREDDGFVRLLAAVVLARGSAADPADLRRRVAALLPEYMVPSTIEVVPALPLTANGKVDRSALGRRPERPATPLPPWRRKEAGASRQVEPAKAPASDGGLLATVREVLRTPDLSPDDNFLEAGATSVDIIRLGNVVDALEGIKPDMDELFRGSTSWLEGVIAQRAATAEDAGVPDGLRLPPGARLEVVVDEAVPGGPDPGRYGVAPDGSLIPAAPAGPVPATSAQRRLWLLHRVDPASVAYHELLALRLTGPVDPAALERGLRAVVDRHDALRLQLRPGADRLPELATARAELPFEAVDLRGLPAGTAEQRAIALARRPLDLEDGPLARAALLREDDDRWVLALVLHHVLGDRWAGHVIVSELGAVLRGIELPPAPSFLAHAAAEARRRRSDGHVERVAWWRERLRGAPPLELPEAARRPAVPDATGGIVRATVPAPLARAVRELAAAQSATPFMAILAAVGVVLRRHGAGDDLVIGTPHAHRDSPRAEQLVGFLAETLPLRLAVPGDEPFAALVQRARETCLDAYAHADVPFDDIVQAAAPPRASGRPPLVQVALVLQDGPNPAVDLPAVEAATLDLHPGEAKFDLAFELIPDEDDGWTLRVEHAAALLDRRQACALADHLVAVLEGAVAAPRTLIAELDPLGDDERAALEGGPAPEGVDVVARVAEHAATRPDHPAVEEAGGTLTYGALAERSGRLAAALAVDAPAGTVVALLPSSSTDLAVGALAALRAGRPFLPLDRSHPDARLIDALRQAGADCVIASAADTGRPALEGLRHIDPAGTLPEELPATAHDPAATGYLIATSGTTGRPKVVEVPRRGLAWLAAAQGPVFALRPDDRVAQLASPAFDACLSELVVTLAAGATLVGRRADALAGRALRAHFEAAAITVATVTPSVLATVPGDPPSDLRLVVVAGEPCPATLAAEWSRHVELVNAYGPTECAVAVTMHAHPAGAAHAPVLGSPLPGCRCHVVGPDGRPRPLGVPGELLVEGDHIATGYCGAPALTEDRFVSGPDGRRAYRTGDRVRRRPDGTLEYLGRLDRQLKVRGVRVEPGEIEEALSALPGVHGAHVVADGQELVAHVAGAAAAEEGELRRRLARLLPPALVPGRWVWHAELPRTATGKVDLDALGRAGAGAPRSAAAREIADPLEASLAELFGELLGTPVRDREADFFALGGHSLLAVQLHDRILERHGVDLPLGDLLADVRVARLAALVRDRPATGPAVARPVLLAKGGSGAPVVVVHAVDGGVAPYRPLAAALAGRRPVLGLMAPGLVDGSRACSDVAGLVAHHRDVLAALGDEPVVFAGWSFGAVVAHALAAARRAEGLQVGGLVLLDPPPPGPGPALDETLLARIALRGLGALPGADDVADPLAAATASGHLSSDGAARLRAVLRAHAHVLSSHEPVAVDVPAVLAYTQDGAAGAAAWRTLLPGLRTELELSGGHFDAVGDEAAATLAAHVDELSREVIAGG